MSKSIKYQAAGLAAILLVSAPAVHAMSKSSTTRLEALQATKLARLRVLLQQGIAKLQNKDYEGAEVEFGFIIADADYPSLSAEQKYLLYSLLAKAQSERGTYDKAYANLMLAADAAPDARSNFYWYLLWDVSTRLKKYGDAIDAMTALTIADPQNTSYYYLPYVAQTVRNAQTLPDGQQRREKALMALWKAGYKPTGFYSAEVLWFSLFEIEVANGNTEQAKEIAKTFALPNTYISLRVDKRYRPYTETDPAHFNLKALTDKHIANNRAKLLTHPRQAEGVVYLMLNLIDANRLTEALALGDEAIARAAKAPAGKPAFDDMDDQWHWLLNTRTRVLEKLGRDAESEASQIKSRDEALAKKQDTVSQRINLGDFYYEHDRPQEALAQVSDMAEGSSSPYGLMAAEEVRTCAYTQLNDQAKLAKSLDYIRAHAADGYGPTRSALLCANDLDGLAAITIARLDDPLLRNDTLRLWQTYRPEAYPTAVRTQMRQRAAAFVAREDVKAALLRYGYIDTYDIFSPYN
ncbi:hypothetical protein [Asticcacaulis sp.]|uniref:hypothetical protein n=1 Tax=Asticcacaulis sp. TaxID=1872648 RepID=UPI002D01E281|nr:hypothetical protein [Asticcacaulis sp.]HTM83034.1 hypothetical protein [Asticcacaulis sp.]